MSNDRQRSFEQIRDYGMQLRRQLEYAEAVIEPLCQELILLFRAGLLPDLVYRGDVILVEPYEGEDPDSGRAYIAVLSTSHGFGAAQYDTEELFVLRNDEEGSREDARRRIVPFRDLPGRLRARLLPQVETLVKGLRVDLHLASYLPEPKQAGEPHGS